MDQDACMQFPDQECKSAFRPGKTTEAGSMLTERARLSPPIDTNTAEGG